MSAVRKEERADLRAKYRLYIQIGLLASLLLLIFAFRADLQGGETPEFVLQEQEVVEIEEVQQTEQIETPPPPPRPPVPVEVPNDADLQDQPLDLDASLDIDQPLNETPPPPPSDDEEDDGEPEIFVVVEEMPEPMGGIAGIQDRVRYPSIAQRAGVEGTVYVQFVVTPEGRVEDAAVTRGIGAGCDEEALRVIRETEFTPGMQRGEPVPVRMSLPVRFQLR